MRRMAMEVDVLESPDLGAPSRYLKHILLNSRKILEASEVEEFRKKCFKRILHKFISKFRNLIEIFSFFNGFFDFRGLYQIF